MSNQMQSVAAQAAIGQEPVTKTFTVAITGDSCSDLMAAITRVADDSGLSARQVQYIFECYAKLYKDAADANDRDVEMRQGTEQTKINELMRQLQAERDRSMAQPASPWDIKTTYAAPGLSEMEYRKFIAEMKARGMRNADQSGIHSPSTIRPDSAAGSGSETPGPMGWPVDDKF